MRSQAVDKPQATLITVDILNTSLVCPPTCYHHITVRYTLSAHAGRVGIGMEECREGEAPNLRFKEHLFCCHSRHTMSTHTAVLLPLLTLYGLCTLTRAALIVQVSKPFETLCAASGTFSTWSPRTLTVHSKREHELQHHSIEAYSILPNNLYSYSDLGLCTLRPHQTNH